jgi:hypothetical protein
LAKGTKKNFTGSRCKHLIHEFNLDRSVKPGTIEIRAAHADPTRQNDIKREKKCISGEYLISHGFREFNFLSI